MNGRIRCQNPTHTTTIGRTAKRAGAGVETIRFDGRRGLIARPPG